jgi:hypothetical protein
LYDVRYKGEDVFRYHVPRSGLTFASQFEWRLAARYAGMDYDTAFSQLDGDTQSAIVAEYRAVMQMRAVMEYEQQKESRRKKGMRSRG